MACAGMGRDARVNDVGPGNQHHGALPDKNPSSVTGFQDLGRIYKIFFSWLMMPVQTLAPKIEVRPSAPVETTGKAKVSVQDLNFFYAKVQALHDITIEIPERQVMAFIGPSGCGKSTFLRTLNRMNDVIPA